MTEEEFEKVKVGDLLVITAPLGYHEPDDEDYLIGRRARVASKDEDGFRVLLEDGLGEPVGSWFCSDEVERAEEVSGVQAIVPVHVKAHQGFSEAMLARLDAGQREYGDSSFEKALDALCVDMEEELVDLANYAMMGWRRVRALREKLSAIGEVK